MVGISSLRIERDGATQMSLCLLKAAQRLEHHAEVDVGHGVIRTLPYRDSGGLKSFLIPPLIVQGIA